MTDATQDRKVRTQLAWILSLSLLVLAFIFLIATGRLTSKTPSGAYTITIPGPYGGPYGNLVPCNDAPDGIGYVCNPGQGCCEGTCYDKAAERCCVDKPLKPNDVPPKGYPCLKDKEECCKGVCRNPDVERCCTDQVTVIVNANGNLEVIPIEGYTIPLDKECCNGFGYDPFTEECCSDSSINFPYPCKIGACCGGGCYDKDTQKCCSARIGEKTYPKICNKNEECCGIDCYDPATKICCVSTGVVSGLYYQCEIDVEDCCEFELCYDLETQKCCTDLVIPEISNQPFPYICPITEECDKGGCLQSTDT